MVNREAVKIGDLEKNSVAIKLVKPKFNKEIYLNAADPEGVDEFTLRKAGTLRSLTNTADVGASRRSVNYPEAVVREGADEPTLQARCAPSSMPRT